MPVTPNNKQESAAILKADAKVAQAVNRILKLKIKHGGWRGVQEYLGLTNVSYAYKFAMHGELSNNPDVRRILMKGRPDPKEKTMDPLMQRLEFMLKTYHVGKNQAIKKDALLKEVWGGYAAADKSYNNLYDRKLRGMIEDLIHNHEALICSSPDAGYWWASSLPEGLEVAEKALERAGHQMDNAHHLERNLKQKFGGQLEMKV